ncbi:MAG TPA: MFS transporter [Acetobacteraceae bacterium]|nr:MFS transporter [Acetobacteraceae bacterium]
MPPPRPQTIKSFFASFCSQKEGLASLPVAAFLAAIFMPAGIAMAFLPLWLAERGLSAAAIGQVLGVATLARLLATPGWGRLADHLGRRPVLGAAAGLTTLACLALLPAQGFALLMLVVLLQGAAASALAPVTDALTLGLAQQRRLDYGRVRATGSAAFMAATALGGWLVDLAGVRIVPLLLAGCYAAATLLAIPLPDHAAPRPAERPRFGQGGLELLRYRPFLLTLASSALIQGAHAAYYGLASLYWRQHGLSDTLIGLLWAEGLISEIALFFWGRRLAERLGPAGLTALAALASILRWGVTGATTALPALLVVQLLHGATFGMQHYSAMLMLNRTVAPSRAATAQTLHATLGSSVPTGLLIWFTASLFDGGGQVFLLMALLAGFALLLVPALRRAWANAA